MLADFFQTTVIPNDVYAGYYDLRLVLLSFMVATSASYIALDLTGRLRDISNTPTSIFIWIIGGAIAMGAGIWSMHFIGMLSFSIPGLQLRYDLFWTTISLLVAILASGFALLLLRTTSIRVEHYIAGGIILGLGIASMHYTGMEGMLISLNIRYLPSLFLISILVAIVASEAAIWLSLKSTKVVTRLRNRIKIASALVMGFAICGMHYIGMAASIFTPLCTPSTEIVKTLDPTLLATVIAIVTFIILGVAFIISSYKDALNQQQLEKARQLGMAEISASVLHNVGNVLNSVNVSANTVLEKIKDSKLSDLDNINLLFKEHNNDLVNFLANDQRGLKALNYLELLSQHLHQERENIVKEMKRLNKNILMIKEIISTQQNLSKTTYFEQIVNINELLSEALLVSGLNLNKKISIHEQYDKLPPIKMDKVKLLQVLVNLIQNAKDAVIESSKSDKEIILKSSLVNNIIKIEISDNGIGILPDDKNKIFIYGFTTKTSGHGFGLHTAAIIINELGGSIRVESEGYEKGTRFIIELPVKSL